jgi:hypothetical protein
MAVNNQVKALLQQAIDLIDEEPAPSVPTPTPTPAPETPVETPAKLTINSFSNDDWDNGVYKKSYKALSMRPDARIVKGTVLRLANTQSVNVIAVQAVGENITVSIDQVVKPSEVGGKPFEIVKTPVATTPEAPVTPSQPAPVTPNVPASDPVAVPAPNTALKLLNIAMLGLNFAAHPNASQVQPGEAGTHFKWFSKKDVDYWVGEMGVRLIRWPYELQRSMVAETSTGLPSKTGQLDSTFVAKVKERYEWIRAASNGEAKIIFDPHHYWRIWRNQTASGKQTGSLLSASQAAGQGGRWKAQERILIDDANGWGPKELGLHLVNFIKALDDPMVIGYGTGNEPYPSAGGFDGIGIQVLEKRIVDFHNIILPMMHEVTDKPAFVCGNHWASARMWAQVSGSFVDGIKDKNVIFEWHGYGDLDNSSSGAYSNVSTFPADQLVNVFSPAFAYHSKKGTRGFTGETGIPPTDSARTMLQKALEAHEKANVPMTLWVGAGDEAMNGEKMYLDTADHAKTREMLKPWFAKRFAEWTPVRG